MSEFYFHLLLMDNFLLKMVQQQQKNQTLRVYIWKKLIKKNLNHDPGRSGEDKP